MKTYNNINKPFWIAHSDDLKIVHHGQLKKEGSEVGTAQPNFLSYDDETKWKIALIDLGVDLTGIDIDE
jgi:hypothetical protein